MAACGITWRRRGATVGALAPVSPPSSSPPARHGYVDHTPMDTTSILRFITRRFELPTLHGITVRDNAVASYGEPPLGDLTSALDLSAH